MPTHAEQRHLPHTQKQLFELVAGVEKYPEFLPWCTATRITRKEGQTFFADLVVQFKVFKERFSSKVTLHPNHQIDVEYIQGPFRYLNNHWRFIEAEDGGCVIDFYVDFEFRSRILQKMIGLLFNEAVSRMVGAFETRARNLYGPNGIEAAAAAESEAEPSRPAASRA
jgi:coenzyme Q-binding protein COQ10